MNKQIRQYAGLLSAIIAYYLIHEGAHLFCALFIDAFKQINLIGAGMQIDIYSEKMAQAQLGVFVLQVGAVAALLSALEKCRKNCLLGLKSGFPKNCGST